MPLEVKFISYDRPEVFPLKPSIEPGKVGAWLDKSFGLSSYIVARCLKTDTGGEIFFVEDTLRTNAGALVVPFDDSTPSEKILMGLPFEQDILDYEDEHGRLVIQHVLPDGQYSTFN